MPRIYFDTQYNQAIAFIWLLIALIKKKTTPFSIKIIQSDFLIFFKELQINQMCAIMLIKINK